METMENTVQTGPTFDEQKRNKQRYQKKIDSCRTFSELIKDNPMTDAIIEEVDQRKIRVGQKWLIDYASCNYLGFDLDPEIMSVATNDIQKFGTYPSWSRLLGSPRLYWEIEEKLTDLLHAPDTLILPSITLLHLYTIPMLAEAGDIFLDKRAHKTIFDGCSRARNYGANLISFRHNDMDHLEELLSQSKAEKKMICVDGVYSMHGYTPPVLELIGLAKKYKALVYIDDAHGFGVLGERAPDELCPFGKKGNSIINYHDVSFDNVVLIGSLSKAYSNLLGFMTCSPELKKFLKTAVDPYLYSGPAPIPVLSMLLKSLEVNEKRGDNIRADLYRKSKNFYDGLAKLGYRNDNHTMFPVYRVTIENADDIDFAGQFLHDNGIYVTLAPYPLVPKNEVGFRIQITASNTDEEIDYLLKVLKNLGDHIPIQKKASARDMSSEVHHA